MGIPVRWVYEVVFKCVFIQVYFHFALYRKQPFVIGSFMSRLSNFDKSVKICWSNSFPFVRTLWRLLNDLFFYLIRPSTIKFLVLRCLLLIALNLLETEMDANQLIKGLLPDTFKNFPGSWYNDHVTVFNSIPMQHLKSSYLC